MDMCLLCLELKDDGIDIMSKRWQEENIGTILEKHFSPLKSLTSTSWLCSACWKIVNDFHKFYLHVEDVHTFFASELKIEVLEGNESSEPFPNDDTSREENTIESNFSPTFNTTKDTMSEMKTEYITEEPPISLDIERVSKSNENDPLEKSLETSKKIVRKLIKSTKETNESSDEENHDESIMDESDVEENSQNSTFSEDDYIQNSVTESDSESSDNDDDTPPPKQNEKKSRSNAYCIPRPRRTEVNEFIAKHYKINCIICQAPMQTFNELCKHSSEEHNEPAYVVCCNKKFFRCNLLADHIYFHVDPNYFKCKHCGKVLSDRRTLEKHVTRHDQKEKHHICNICQEAFWTRNGLRNHKLIHPCKKKVPSNVYYNPRPKGKDVNEFIAKHYDITCFICQAPMQAFSDLRKHFSEKHKEQERAYVMCCNKKFFTCNLLADHVYSHVDPDYLKCKHCGKVMSDRRNLELHVRTHEGQSRKYVCDTCQKRFLTSDTLKVHQAIHLSDEEKKYSCEHCGKRFGHHKLLGHHVRSIHFKMYGHVCDICGEKLRSKEVLERHLLKHKGAPLPSVTCDICGRAFTNKYGLKVHKDAQHPKGGKRQFTCDICSKISPTIRSHRSHVKNTHVLGYNFKCTLCEKAFKRQRSFKEHMAIHTGDDLYTCQFCPKTFKSHANLSTHRRKTHPKEWEEYCRAKYSGNLPPQFKVAETSVNIEEKQFVNV
ncbi:zinc finger autosomal protein-like [Musca autumnalis]|uniref:zinc finger autosomal protein-like n=1 Tax=Musca autumnalis TaxID=221902 RepID=UPI003CEF56EE